MISLFLKPLLRVHLPSHSSHLHECEVRPPVHKNISNIFFFNAVFLGSLLSVFFVLLDKDGRVIRIPFRKCTDRIRNFFVCKEKPFGRGKVRHKIADCLERGDALPYCQLVKACMRKISFQAPGAELSGFYCGLFCFSVLNHCGKAVPEQKRLSKNLMFVFRS